MSTVDTLKIYDELKASGIPESQAHAQATAIAHANRVTPEDLAKIEQKILDTFERLTLKIDLDMKWMRLIGGAMIVAFMGSWFK